MRREIGMSPELAGVAGVRPLHFKHHRYQGAGSAGGGGEACVSSGPASMMLLFIWKYGFKLIEYSVSSYLKYSEQYAKFICKTDTIFAIMRSLT
jgi:hypothetical protein